MKKLSTALSMLVSLGAAAQSLKIDEAKREVTLVTGSGDPVPLLNQAVNYLLNREDKTVQWRLILGGGDYVARSTIRFDRLKNVHILGSANSRPAFQKPAGGGGEYLASCLYCEGVTVDGLSFQGRTRVYDPANVQWGDQGLFWASTKNCVIRNSAFADFGNAAIRMTTYFRDPVLGINSFDNRVEFNTFRNIQQITTTSDGTLDHGGSANYYVVGNTFSDLRGAIKFASRVPVSGAHALFNRVLNGDHYGFDISGYDDIEIVGNQVSNVKGWGISLSTNNRVKKDAEFAWAARTEIRNNEISNAQGGVSFYNAPYTEYGYWDGRVIKFARYPTPRFFIARDLLLDHNTVTGAKGYVFALRGVENVRMSNNSAPGFTGRTAVILSGGSTLGFSHGNEGL